MTSIQFVYYERAQREAIKWQRAGASDYADSHVYLSEGEIELAIFMQETSAEFYLKARKSMRITS